MIYIKKQEVCFGCPCFNETGSYCNITEEHSEKPCDTVLSNCPLPLASVPEGHGDLIDRNELVDKLSERKYCDKCSNNLNGIACGCCIQRNNDDRMIDILYGEEAVVTAH